MQGTVSSRVVFLQGWGDRSSKNLASARASEAHICMKIDWSTDSQEFILISPQNIHCT